MDAAIDYGFGFVEVGSVTFRGGPGNPRPRMFRLDGQTIMNRMGLNGDPAEVVAARLARVRTPFFGVNIAKTHSPDILGDAAIEDICAAYRLVGRFGLYTAINVSCPNTREGRTFEDPGPLAELLSAVNALRRGRQWPAADCPAPPLVVKLSPVLDPGGEGKERGRSRLAGSTGCWTSAKRPAWTATSAATRCRRSTPASAAAASAGRPSAPGVPDGRIHPPTLDRQGLDRPVIGCGGVFEPRHLDGYLRRGCVAAQAYNGFVRGPLAGVRFAHRIAGGYERIGN